MYNEPLLLEKRLRFSFTSFYDYCHILNTINCYTDSRVQIGDVVAVKAQNGYRLLFIKKCVFDERYRGTEGSRLHEQ